MVWHADGYRFGVDRDVRCTMREEVRMHGIEQVAEGLGLGPEAWIPIGRDKAKVDVAHIGPPRGRLILVTAINPTPAGEGKTTTSIGLVQALHQRGLSVCGALREPSLGPCFGIKGGGTGGGRAVLVPTADINLHFTGDLHAITAAHNLVAAMLDNHLHFGSTPALDPQRILWPRVMDQNDRALRDVMVAMDGPVRRSRFDITAASEIMAMLCLATDADDLRARVDRTVIAWTPDREPFTIGQLGATGAVMVLLRDALMPNLVQTVEGAPVLVHGGPFANIAHGCNSVIATRAALGLADWVVTEAGFGADLGAEKFVDIKCRMAGLDPAAVVVVATIRALKHHGGGDVAAGLGNLAHHLDTVAAFGKSAVVACNAFPDDTEADRAVLERFCVDRGVGYAHATHFRDGGAGAMALADAVLEAAATPSDPIRPLYDLTDPLHVKIEKVACGAYGARGVRFAKGVRRKLKGMTRRGWGELPVCMAKTPASLSDDPSRPGRPTDFDVTVQDVRINTGAGFVVVLLGDISRMPGLPRVPAAVGIDLVDGEIQGVA
jgi:formate--tetrahydrofolate ligase